MIIILLLHAAQWFLTFPVKSFIAHKLLFYSVRVHILMSDFYLNFIILANL